MADIASAEVRETQMHPPVRQLECAAERYETQTIVPAAEPAVERHPGGIASYRTQASSAAGSPTASTCTCRASLSHGAPPRPGIDAASQALGHADLNTTLGIYGHRDQTDLETAMDAYASWLEQQRENEIVPPEADR